MIEVALPYGEHVATLCKRSATALEVAGRDTLAVAAGQGTRKFLDDQDLPYVVHPHFRQWLPLADAPGSWLIYTPGSKPRLLFMQPRDFWYPPPQMPDGYWVDCFDITVVHDRGELAAALPKDAGRCAIIGQAQDAVDGFVPDNPQMVMDYLHYHRAFKTDYELAVMRQANRMGATAHRAAAAAFRDGGSEFDIHMAYLQAIRQIDAELPYHSIVALNRHGATLHYDRFDRQPPPESLSLLIDAGATHAGYASDITRTHAGAGADGFRALIDGMESNQQKLSTMVREGVSYADLQSEAHRLAADALVAHDFVRVSASEAVESGITRAFFPHGVGHLIGTQVHDVGGFQSGTGGGRTDPPEDQPFLRLTRTLAPGMVVTIEPGLYFIDMLLDRLRATPAGRGVNWARVDAFRRYGGIRIEDNVACTTAEPENLTRDAFAAT